LKFQILKFQMEEAANAKANGNAEASTNANAYPSSLKAIRDDSLQAFFRAL
jgi:hypothetical protein